MYRGEKLRAVLISLAATVLISCGGIINLPVPTVTTISPSTVIAGSTQFTLKVNGSGFAPSSVIEFNSSPRNTIFDQFGHNELSTVVTPSDISSPGTISVTVFSPQPGGGTSTAVSLNVTPATLPKPQITFLSPNSVPAMGDATVITINGTNFVPTSIATVNQNNRQTNYVNGSELQLTLDSEDILTAGTVQIAVLNPPAPGNDPPGGGLSNSATLNVVNPAPVLNSLRPVTITVDTGSATLTASGSGMDSASQIYVNGSARPTTFSSTSQVTAQLTNQDVANAGVFTAEVVNPPPGGGTSAPNLFYVVPTSTGVGLPELVDYADDGTQANNGVNDPTSVGPTMDTTGRFVAFASPATNLLLVLNQPLDTNPDTNGVPDIFLRDTCFNAGPSCTPKTTLIDSGPEGAISNGASYDPAMNANGSELAFISLGTNLVTEINFDGVTPQAFTTTTCAGSGSGCTPTVGLVSLASDGVSPANGTCSQVAISADGRFIAFVSTATNLVSGSASGTPEVYLRDTCLRAGSTCVPSTTLISAAPDGVTPGDGVSSGPAVADGNFGQVVTFSSTATNLLAGSGGEQEVYAVQLCIGIATGCTPSHAVLISTHDGTTFANGASAEPSLTPDGRYVAFASTATNLGAASGGMQEIYLRDTCESQPSGCTEATSLISVAPNGMTPGNNLSEHPTMGNTAQYIAFTSLASNLTTTNTNGIESLYVRNACVGISSGCTTSTVLVSVSATGTSGNGASLNPVMDSGAHVVAFYSAASNLVYNDLNSFPDVFLAVTTF